MHGKDKKKPSKKSLEYVRPQPGTFQLEAFPTHEFRFRKITIDDEAWVKDTFGKSVWDIMNGPEAEMKDLCRLYFHFLVEEDQMLFPPEKRDVINRETGEIESVFFTGPRKFMQKIDGGTLTEPLMIAQAFMTTVLASRPFTDLPDDLKKRVLEWAGKQQKAPEPEKPRTP